MMPKYLVTGGSGFIGSNIVEFLLNRGESVRVIDNFSTGYKKNIDFMLDDVELFEGDITKTEDCCKAVEGVDYVLHQAAIPSVPRSVSDPILTHHANITGVLNMLIAARDAKVKRFVYAGSSSAYGNKEGEFKTENIIPEPLSPYAAQKLCGEYYLKTFSECFGMETVSIRYFNVFGPRQDPDSPYSAVIPLFINAVLEDRSPTVHGDGLQTRDFTFVENVVRGNILAATADYSACGQVYNVACGGSYSVLDLLTGINDVLGTDIKPEFTEARVGDVRDSKADISRARKDFGYEVAVSFEEGLRRTIEWYKDNSS